MYQGFIQALLLTSAFHEGLSFTAAGHNPTRISKLSLPAGGLYGSLQTSLVGCRGNVLESFGYFTDPSISNSLSTHHSVT